MSSSFSFISDFTKFRITQQSSLVEKAIFVYYITQLYIYYIIYYIGKERKDSHNFFQMIKNDIFVSENVSEILYII